LDGGTFVTDGGIATTLVHLEGIDLPSFAAFVLLDDTGTGAIGLRDYYRSYGQLSRTLGVGIVLDTPTWRANPTWGAILGYHAAALDDLNQRAVDLLADVRNAFQGPANPIVISGCVGPRAERYATDRRMTVAEAFAYHLPQVRALAAAGVDVVTATTMTHPAEAAGIVRAALHVERPAAVGFTVEPNGRLPDGTSLADAVAAVDADTGGGPAYFLVSCAHPSHFVRVLSGAEPWVGRIRGVRANASTASHLPSTPLGLCSGDEPDELAYQIAALHRRLPHLTVLGGCCGTDERHIEQIALAVRRR
jgi:S-methylmethionine-dependent homocysteine/selenocysteine methylase